jgi:hypothetical protein
MIILTEATKSESRYAYSILKSIRDRFSNDKFWSLDLRSVYASLDDLEAARKFSGLAKEPSALRRLGPKSSISLGILVKLWKRDTEDYYFDDADFVRGDKTIIPYNKNMTVNQFFNILGM